MLDILRHELLRPARLKAERQRLERMLKELAKREARRTPSKELARIDAQIKSVKRLGLPQAAVDAALEALSVERESLSKPRGDSVARKLLARLPDFPKEFEAQLTLALDKGAPPEAIEQARGATRALLKDGRIDCYQAKGGGAEAKICIVGFSAPAPVLHTRSSGSGGRI